MKTQKIKIILIICLVLTLMLFSIFSFLICNNFKGFANYTTNTNLDNANKISQANSSNNCSTDQNINNNEDRQDNPQNENSKITNTSTCVSVGEIWNDNLKQFDGANLLQLIKYATNSIITLSDISAIKNRTVNANTMRGYNGSKDILVTLGGLQWTPTYFSQDTSGNPILTLWLANSSNTSSWNSGFGASDNSLNSSYPDVMYGTSYIRAVTLNNGGWYSTSSGGGSGATASKNSSNNFAKFTITTSNKTAIADYVVTPAYVLWQEKLNLQSPNGSFYHLSNNYSMTNDAYEKGQSNSYFINDCGGYGNFSNKDKYDAWKNDLIWLVSLAEAGSVSHGGLWGLSTNQKSNSINSLIRSARGGGAGDLFGIPASGSGDLGISPSQSLAVRPALHLNLTEAINSAFDMWGNTQFVLDNLNLLLKYVNGTNTATTNSSLLSSLSSTIGSGAIKSSAIKINANKVTDKAFINSNSELVIKFGGLYWYAVYLTKNTSGQIILTMWLTDSSQLYSKNKVSSTAYNKYGSGTFNSGSPPYKDGASTISNNYGNNYVRTTLLSSGNTTSVFYPYLKTSTNKTAMGDFIISPNALNTQDALNLQKTQSAKSTFGFRYNLPNESYSNLINYSTPYKNLSLSSTTTNYTAWQNDKLWLPSLSEVGLGSNNATTNPTRASGLWGLSTAQRSNTNKTATWLRSGHVTDKNLAYTISSDGLDYGYETINTQNGIRPALHLNLTLACQYSS